MRKAGKPPIRGLPGCRSEEKMSRSFFAVAIIGTLTLFTVNASSQSSALFADVSGPAASSGNSADMGRQRVVTDRTSGAKASVVVNIQMTERALFDLINQKRVENGLKPLVWADDLLSIARGHSQNMVNYGYFSHRDVDNRLVSDRADLAGLRNWRAIGENIAFSRGFQDPIVKTAQLWLDSPSHRRNLLDSNWREGAIGLAVGSDGSYFFTQVFMVRK